MKRRLEVLIDFDDDDIPFEKFEEFRHIMRRFAHFQVSELMPEDGKTRHYRIQANEVPMPEWTPKKSDAFFEALDNWEESSDQRIREAAKEAGVNIRFNPDHSGNYGPNGI